MLNHGTDQVQKKKKAYLLDVVTERFGHELVLFDYALTPAQRPDEVRLERFAYGVQADRLRCACLNSSAVTATSYIVPHPPLVSFTCPPCHSPLRH